MAGASEKKESAIAAPMSSASLTFTGLGVLRFLKIEKVPLDMVRTWNLAVIYCSRLAVGCCITLTIITRCSTNVNNI